MLAKIRALAGQTIDNSPDLATFRENFDRRLAAIARTQDLFADDPHTGAGLNTLIRRELEAHGAREGEQFTLEGPQILVSARAVQSLGMAFHELATNAIKYGALSVPGGRIAVRWRVDDVDGAEGIVLEWRETGMDIREPPKRRGFGSEIVQEGLSYMLGGTSDLAFPREGAKCIMRFPLSSIVSARDPIAGEPLGSTAV
jgi:two-component system CheB/CheR fusion protein